MPIPQLSKGHAFFSKIEGKICLYNSMKDDEKIIISIKSAQELIKNGHSKTRYSPMATAGKSYKTRTKTVHQIQDHTTSVQTPRWLPSLRSKRFAVVHHASNCREQLDNPWNQILKPIPGQPPNRFLMISHLLCVVWGDLLLNGVVSVT